MGMASPERSSTNPLLEQDSQVLVEKLVECTTRVSSEKCEVSGEMAKEEGVSGDSVARMPAPVKGSGVPFSRPGSSAGSEPLHFDLGNGSARRRSVGLISKRDGFPAGFSALGSRRGITKSVGGIATRAEEEKEKEGDERREESGDRGERTATTSDIMEGSSRSMAVYFDSEQMDRGFVDDSPVYGSAGTELTPELGSFRVRGESDDDDGSDGAVQSRLETRTELAFPSDEETKRRSVSKRKKKKEAPLGDEATGGQQQQQLLPIKRQLHADFVLGANEGSKREGYISSRLFAKPLAGRDEYVSNHSSPSPDVRAQGDANFGVAVGTFEITIDDVGNAAGWSNIYPRGDQPEPRQFHAAAVVGRRMVVVGGQTAYGPCNDVQMLHLSKMTWSELGRAREFPKAQSGNVKATPWQLPPCRGHSLISWGKTVLLVGGEMSPSTDRVEVWSFDLETESWTKVTAKGEVPAARSGQSVTRAGSILIMFGGESLKGQKLNDLHILDLKSLMWLPLHTSGSGPSPRTKHCATMYDDRYLLVFGGASKCKALNDLFALDFETMEWSKMKTKGISPSPRCGHAGILVGEKWYIAGGDAHGHGSIETLMLDVSNLTWFAIAATTPNSVVVNQGLSLVLVQRKEKTMLVAFGGKGTELSNQVHSLYIVPLDHVKTSSYGGMSEVRDGQANATTPRTAGSGLYCGCVDVAKTHLTSLAEEQYGSRYSPGHSPSTEGSFDVNGHISLRRRYGPEKSKFPVVRQPPAEILSRVLRETSAQECSPLQHLQPHKAADAVPVLDLETSEKLTPIATRSSENMRRPGGSSRRKGSFDSTLTSVIESAEYVDSSRGVAMVADLKSQSSERSESLYTTNQRHGWEGEECSDSQLLADLQDAMTMERRIHVINKYRQNFEMKLSAAVRKGEVAEGHLTTALRGKEEAERNLVLAMKTRQQAEGKLAASLKAQRDLKERVDVAERAQEDSNNLCNVVHSENLRLEHDLAFLKAILEDTQKELQSTREVLVEERARSFQIQMEVFDLKKKLSPTMVNGETPKLTSETLFLPVSENV